ncbi:MAG: cupin domain-containing protein [Candidatus Aminicenantales bacterium]
MKELMKGWEGTPYPEMIRKLPEINVPFKGLRGWLIQGGSHQVVFFDIEPIGKVPPHTHCAQWGIVLEGRMSLTIGEETKVFEKGDWYYIPEGIEHSAFFLTRVNAIDVFDAPDRYKVKS